MDAEDIDAGRAFESLPLIEPYLESGFELEPSSITSESQGASLLLVHGDPWTRVVTYTYRRDGKIVYRKLTNGQYEAKVSAPRTSLE